MKILQYIAQLGLAVLLLMLLSLAPTMAQDPVYPGMVTTLAVDSLPGNDYSWQLYDNANVDFAIEDGKCPATSASFVGDSARSVVKVEWKKPGIYYYKVYAGDILGCGDNLKIGMIEVKESLPTAMLTQPNYEGVCVGEEFMLEIRFTGTAPWSFKYTDGNTEWEVTDVFAPIYYLKPAVEPPIGDNKYWITSVTDKYATNTEDSNVVTQVITPKPDPSDIYHR